MKKTIAIVCILTIMLCFCSCNNVKDNNSIISQIDGDVGGFVNWDNTDNAESALSSKINSSTSSSNSYEASSVDNNVQSNTDNQSTFTPSSSTDNTNNIDSDNSYQSNKELWERKMVAITLDDGPQETNPQLLDIFKSKNAKATFFLIGKNMEKYPEIVKRIADEGHEIGYHSYESLVGPNSAESYMRKDFNKAASILEKIGLDYEIKLYRNHGGQYSDKIRKVTAEFDWRVIGWTNYGFDDSTEKSVSPQDRMNGVFKKGIVTNGSILLIHPRDNEEILEGVGLLIDKLQADGYELVTVSELLKRRNGGTAGVHYSTVIY